MPDEKKDEKRVLPGIGNKGSTDPKNDGKSFDDKKKKKRKYHGRGRDGNPKPKDDKPKKSSGYDNDLSWYAAHQNLVDDVASLPLRYPLGSNVGAGDVIADIANNAFESNAWPGIMSLEFVPMYGKSTAQSSALNIALRNIYQEIRQKNAGAKNYEAADLGCYLILMDSIYSLIAEGKRAYGLCSYSDIYNWYEPNDLVAAAGFNYGQISSNKAIFRSRLNERIVKINNFAVPSEWNIMVRHYWLNSMVFSDDEDVSKAQLFISKQMNHYTWYDYANSKMRFYNTFNKVNGVYNTLDDYFNRLDALIDNVYLFDDASLMSGDILKAYESSGLIAINMLENDYVTPIVHSKEVLQQIRNTMFVTFETTDPQNYCEINQSLGNGGIFTDPKFRVDVTDFTLGASTDEGLTALNEVYSKSPIYLDDEFADAKGIMIATRNMTLGAISRISGDNTHVLLTPTEVASEVYCAGRLYNRRMLSTASILYNLQDHIYDPDVNSSLNNYYFRSIQFHKNNLVLDSIRNLSLQSKYSYFPQSVLIACDINVKDDELNTLGIFRFGEMRAVGYVNRSTLGNIHRVAILSLLGSKAFGSGTSQLEKK